MARPGDAGRSGESRGALGWLLILNVVCHFLPWSRPGFQPDDYWLLNLSRAAPGWEVVRQSLAQETRPLGWLLYILLPRVFGLEERSQLAILVVSTTLLTALVYVTLSRIVSRPLAGLATLAFVVWPVKHEIYSSQLLAIVSLTSCLILAGALAYERWSREESRGALILSAGLWGLSLFIYDLGLAAPLVYRLALAPKGGRRSGLSVFLLPLAFYGLYFAAHRGTPLAFHVLEPTSGKLLFNLASSLPSNLFGFQVARNIGYGWWAVVGAPAWFQAMSLLIAAVVARTALRWASSADAGIGTGTGASPRASSEVVLTGLVCAALLAAPAAVALVESRHSVLAAAAMGLVLAVLLVGARRITTVVVIGGLALATQGLALRQAEISEVQEAVHARIVEERADIEAAATIVVDIGSLSSRLPHTWSRSGRSLLKNYWGMVALPDKALIQMIVEVVPSRARFPEKTIRSCAGGLEVLNDEVRCRQDGATEVPFSIPREGAVIVSLASVPLPPSVR